MLIKIVINFIWSIFWWCPALYFFKHGISTILEIRCDLQVTKGKSRKEVLAYLFTLTKVAQKSMISQNPKSVLIVSHLSGDHGLFQRVQLIVKYNHKKKNIPLMFASLVLSIFMFCISFLFVFQTYFIPPVHEIDQSAEFFIKQNKDGTFTLVDGNSEVILTEQQLCEMEQNKKRSK